MQIHARPRALTAGTGRTLGRLLRIGFPSPMLRRYTAGSSPLSSQKERVLLKPQVRRFALVLALACACLAAPLQAETPIQLSLFDVNLPEDEQVSGVRFPVLYGKDGGTIRGLDLQLLAYSEMDSLTGISFPLFIAGANHVTGDVTGISWGLFNWHEGQDTGLNVGVANVTRSVEGLNWGVVNVAEGHSVADIGGVSVSGKSNFQLSFVNVTEELKGLQIGLINCAKNGFLPCFVLFNFAGQ